MKDAQMHTCAAVKAWLEKLKNCTYGSPCESCCDFHMGTWQNWRYQSEGFPTHVPNMNQEPPSLPDEYMCHPAPPCPSNPTKICQYHRRGYKIHRHWLKHPKTAVVQCVVSSVRLMQTGKSKVTGLSVPRSAVLGPIPPVLGFTIPVLKQDSKSSLLGPIPVFCTPHAKTLIP